MPQDDDDAPVTANHHIQHQFPHNVRFCPLCGGAMRRRTVLPDRRRFRVCASCGFIDFPGPKLVSGCLVLYRGCVLLLRRGIMPQIGQWTFPGGYVDLGETPEQAALRETREEVGMHVQLGRLLGIYSDPAHPVAAVVVYLATPGNEEARGSDEALEVRYFAREDIPWAALAFRTTADALRDWIALPQPD